MDILYSFFVKVFFIVFIVPILILWIGHITFIIIEVIKEAKNKKSK